jgi:acetyl-CoA/propionyl-CoA carboxylase biotin carboxyl carrier protein
MPTVIPFHSRVVDDAAYVGDGETFGVYTSWIETEFDNTIAPYDGETATAEPADREVVTIEVGGKRLAVSLPAGLVSAGSAVSVTGSPAGGTASGKRPGRRTGKSSAAAAGGDALTAPMQGTIVKLAVDDGQLVAAGDLVVVLEAMKMEQPINAHKAGTVTGLTATVGATVTSGTVLCEISD